MTDEVYSNEYSDDSLSTLALVNSIASDVLEELGACDVDNTVGGSDIYHKAIASDKTIEANIPITTFRVYLSKLVNSEKSLISRPQGKYGYYLNQTKPLEPTVDETFTADDTIGEKTPYQGERLLYPVIRDWFRERGYGARIVANAKGGGQWGNPDVAGIYCNDALGVHQIEVVTAEAKLSYKDWKRWFFEAVSHKRFANRAYFAFAHPEKLISKLPHDLRYYSELYNVGVLIIAMSDDQYKRLLTGTLEGVALVNNENVNVIELYTALYSVVQPRYQILYLQRTLGVQSFSMLAQWEDEE